MSLSTPLASCYSQVFLRMSQGLEVWLDGRVGEAETAHFLASMLTYVEEQVDHFRGYALPELEPFLQGLSAWQRHLRLLQGLRGQLLEEFWETVLALSEDWEAEMVLGRSALECRLKETPESCSLATT